MIAVIAGTGASLAHVDDAVYDRSELRIGINYAVRYIFAPTHLCNLNLRAWLRDPGMAGLAPRVLATSHFARVLSDRDMLPANVDIAPPARYSTEAATVYAIARGATTIRYVGCDCDDSRHPDLIEHYSMFDCSESAHNNAYYAALCIDVCRDHGVEYVFA